MPPAAHPLSLSPATRALHHAWLLELTALPTAAGRESRIIEWIRRWTKDRPDLTLHEDPAGNLHIHFATDPFTAASPTESTAAPAQSRIPNPKSKIEEAPVYFTAHLDHPAFVIERILAPAAIELSFRGGVMDDYFTNARIVVHSAEGTHPATLTGQAHGPSSAFKYYSADLDRPTDALQPGDVATWELPEPRIEDGLLYTHACDDLASLVASLAAFDVLRQERTKVQNPRSTIQNPSPSDIPQPTSDIPVRLLFTRAEEIGFIGAIAACRNGSIPKSAKVIALEVSRSFDDSPIGGGPIVRVGDRLSTFCPSLTAAIARRAEDLSGSPAIPTAAEKRTQRPEWRWQRKLMPGGACEASVFCSAGYDATCLCLPLGNYHNMADLAAVQAGNNTTPPRVGPEFIAISDFDGLVDLLIACGREPLTNPSLRERIDKLWQERAFVLQER